MTTIAKEHFMSDFWGKKMVLVEADALKEQLQILEKYRIEAETLKAEKNRLKVTNQYLADNLQELRKDKIFIDLRG